MGYCWVGEVVAGGIVGEGTEAAYIRTYKGTDICVTPCPEGLKCDEI